MPSTYNNNLRLEIIANGEQSGTWGTTTNNNLGVLLVDAITGVATVNVTTADQAFTILNGVADQSRCAVIELTTSLSSAFNVYAPPVNKTYIIRNTSAQDAVLACDAGTVPPTPAGAGYDIPAGKTVFVYASDESGSWEFHDAVNHLNQALTLDVPLAATEGGTGQSTIAPYSVLVSNSLNTLTPLTVTANQSIKLNSAGTAWEAYSVSAGGITSVTGTPPITSSGGSTPAIGLAANYGDTQNPYASKPSNYVLASPDGSAGVPTFRALSSADLPNIPVTKLNGGSGATASTFWCGNGTWATPTGGGAVSSVTGSGAINASPTTGAVQITVANAGLSTSGIVTTSSQTFGGNKTFDGTITANGLITGGNGFRSTPGSYNFTASNESIFGSSGLVSIAVGGSARIDVTISDFLPDGDNNMGLGSSGKRWTAVYAVNGTIQTSDANSKQDIADLDEAEKRVAVRIKGLIKKFRFKDAVVKKGDAARIHVGVIAQEVRDAFTAEGLDATRYGLFCSDTWWEREEDVYQPFNETTIRKKIIYKEPVEGATEVTQLGVRYDELLAFVIAAM